jgi:hypothetical protein
MSLYTHWIWVNTELGHLDEALAAAEQYVQKGGRNPSILYLLVQLYMDHMDMPATAAIASQLKATLQARGHTPRLLKDLEQAMRSIGYSS